MYASYRPDLDLDVAVGVLLRAGVFDQQLLEPGTVVRAWSRVSVLPGSVSTSRHPDRDSVAAIRTAGKWGSIGR